MSMAVIGSVVKNTHNVLHLLVSSIRIVKLDVEQKNNPPQKKTDKASSAKKKL